VGGLSSDGTISASIAAGQVSDLAGNTNTVSTSSDNTEIGRATCREGTDNQASAQADQTNSLPIHFTAQFSEAIQASTFTSGDVSLSGTAGHASDTVVRSPDCGRVHFLAVGGLSSDGTISASIAAGQVSDLAGNTNTVSTSSDNT